MAKKDKEENKGSAQDILDGIDKEDKKKDSDNSIKKLAESLPSFKFSWKMVSIFLGVILIGSLAFNIGHTGITGKAVDSNEISSDAAAEKVTRFIRQNVAGAQVSVQEKGMENGLHKLDLTLKSPQGTQPLTIFVTLDGKVMFPSAVQLEPQNNLQTQQNAQAQQQAPSVPKSDKPEVELHIFSYCPAGSSTLDTFAPVANLLNDDADFSIRFFSNMHGDYELQQNKIQACIQEVSPDKYWNYADKFYEEVYNNCYRKKSVQCDKEQSVSLMNDVGIDSEEVLACVENKGAELYEADKNRATDLNLRYSPSIVINDVWMEKIDRSPEGIKQAVCSSFNEQPDDCGESLSQQTKSSGSC